jgi:laminin alpha 1/2
MLYSYDTYKNLTCLASAPKGTLITRDHFNGCIRNVMIGGERRDWTDMSELHNIHLNSCPVQ